MDLIYFSPVPWNSIAQRPHFFIRQAIKNGFDNIVWINPTPSRLPCYSDFRRILSPFEANSFEAPLQLKFVNPRLLPIEPFHNIYKLVNKLRINSTIDEIKKMLSGDCVHVVIGKPSILALELLEKIESKSSAFDIMDDFPHFFEGKAKASVNKIMKDTMSSVSRCTYSCINLRHKYGLSDNQNDMLVLNACDESFLNKARIGKRNHRKEEKAIFGYIGTIAAWFDWEAVISLSKKYPESEIHLVGPNYISLPTSLPLNIKFFPAVEHGEVLNVISRFDYGLIPFLNSELTESVDPVKYYEYLACGIPTISTPFGQMRPRIDKGAVFDFSSFSFDGAVYQEKCPTWRERWGAFFSTL